MNTRAAERKNYQSSSKNWLSAVKFAEKRRIRLGAPANCDLYHYAGNNPVKYTDPDGRLTITSYYLTDFLSFQKSTKDMLAIPIGGGLTEMQKDISKLSSAVNLAMGLIPTVGPYAGIFSSDFSLSTLKDTVCSIAGMISDAAGSLLSVGDLAQLINSNPDISANNYTSSQKEYLTMCGIEQAFMKDLSEALKSNGIFNELNTEKGSSFIKNMHVLATDVYDPSGQIKNIAEQVKSTNPLYENIKIN